MCFGVRKCKRTQAGDDDDDDEKTKQTLSDVDVDGFNEHQSRRVSPSSARPQMGYGTQQLDRQAGL